MPHYEQFKTHNSRKKANSKNDSLVKIRSYSKMSRLRCNNSKSQKINPLIIKLSIIVLIISLAFGFLKSGFKDISRIIKSSSGEDNISLIEGASGNAMRSDEEQMSILKDLTFRIFAKPQGDDSVIHEVITDNSDDSDYMSTIITRSALSFMTNNMLTTGDKDPIGGADKLKRLFKKTSKDSNIKSSNGNRIVINDVISYIPKIEFSDRVNNDIESKLQENIYDNSNNNRNSSDVGSRTGTSQSKRNDNSSSGVDIIEAKTFDRILSPKPKKNYDNNLSFVPAKSKRRAKTDSSSSNSNENNKKEKDNKNTTTINDNYNKYSSNNERVVISAEKNYTGNSSINIDKKNTVDQVDKNQYQKNVLTENEKDNSIEKNSYVNRPIDDDVNDIAYNNISKNITDDENKSTKRSEIVNLDDINKNNVSKANDIKDKYIKNTPLSDDNEKIVNIDNISIPSKNDNMSLDRYIVDRRSDTIENKQENVDTSTVNRDIKNNIQAGSVSDSSWKINIDDKKENTINNVSRRPIRTGSILKPSIFLAQYDDRYGTITIIPKERDMGADITIERAVLALLEGASEKEYKDNIISCISTGTTLLDLFVENDTVYLNFNSDFEYNPLGDEGIIIQIYQIVYTVTQFEGIEKVIFLIDGQQKEMIGSDGQILNKVFTRMESENIKAEN